MYDIPTFSRPSRRGEPPSSGQASTITTMDVAAGVPALAPDHPASDAIRDAASAVADLVAQRRELLADVAEGRDGAGAALERLDAELALARETLAAAERQGADQQAADAVLARRKIDRAIDELAVRQEALVEPYEIALATAREHAPALIEAIRSMWALLDQDRELATRRLSADPSARRPGSLHGAISAVQRLRIRGQDTTFCHGSATLEQLEGFLRSGNLDLGEPPEAD